MLVQRYADVRRRAVRTAVEVCHRSVYGVLDQAVLYQGPPTGVSLSDATLMAELSMQCLAYLQHKLD